MIFTPKVFLGIITGLLLLTLAMGLALRLEVQRSGALKQHNAQLQQDLKAQAEALAEMQEQQALTDRVLAQREQQRNRLQQEVNATKLRLRQMEDSADAAYRSCLDQSLPAAVLHELRGQTRTRRSEETVPAHAAYRTDRCTVDRRRHLPGLADVVGGPARRPGRV